MKPVNVTGFKVFEEETIVNTAFYFYIGALYLGDTLGGIRLSYFLPPKSLASFYTCINISLIDLHISSCYNNIN